MSIPRWARNTGGRILNQDLALTAGNFLDDASSFSAWAGIQRQTLSGTNRQVVTWGNRIISGGAEGEKWLYRGGKNGATRMGVKTLAQSVTAGGASASGLSGLARQGAAAIGSRGLFGAVGVALVVSDYNRARREGHSAGGAAVQAGKSAVMSVMVAKGLRLAVANPYTGLAAVAGVGAGAVFLAKDYGNKYLRQQRMQEFGGQLDSAFQTRQAYTMRQRSLNSMAQSRFNVGRALGNEGVMSAMPRARYSNSYGTHMPPMGMY